MAPTLLRGSKPPHLRLLKSSLETRLSAKGLRQRGMWGTPAFLPDTSDAPAWEHGSRRSCASCGALPDTMTQSITPSVPTRSEGTISRAGSVHRLGIRLADDGFDIFDHLHRGQRSAGGGPERAVHGAEAFGLDGCQLPESRGFLGLTHGLDGLAAGGEGADHQPVGVEQLQRFQAQRHGVRVAGILLMGRAAQADISYDGAGEGVLEHVGRPLGVPARDAEGLPLVILQTLTRFGGTCFIAFD